MHRNLPPRQIDFSMEEFNYSKPVEIAKHPPMSYGERAVRFANHGVLPPEQKAKFVPIEDRRTVAEFIDDESSEEEVDLQYIIKKKPDPKKVREFLKEYLSEIKSEEQKLFEQ